MAYPFKKYKFNVTIDGINSPAGDAAQGIGGGFTEVAGFDLSYDVIEYRDGNSPLHTSIKLPGLAKYSNITLKYGTTADITFYNWVTETATAGNNITKHNLTINLLDVDGSTVLATWQVERAWPCHYVATDFNASASEIAFESIELCHEGLTRTA